MLASLFPSHLGIESNATWNILSLVGLSIYIQHAFGHNSYAENQLSYIYIILLAIRCEHKKMNSIVFSFHFGTAYISVQDQTADNFRVVYSMQK